MGFSASQILAAMAAIQKIDDIPGTSTSTLQSILEDVFPINQGSDSAGTGSGSIVLTQTLSADGVTSTPVLSLKWVYDTFTTAEVLAINTTPQTLLAAQGATVAIYPLAVWSYIDFNSAAYITNTDILVEWSGGTDIALLTGALAASADSIGYGLATLDGAEALNQSIRVTEGGGDPATGDSDVLVGLVYLEHDFS